MLCRYCQEPAGWWRRCCGDCRHLTEAFTANRGADMATIMDQFIATGAPRHKVERFLDADVGSAGPVRDQIAADMTNQLLEALGQRRRQTPEEVRRIRARGAWAALDRPPGE
jgi:hypothetical protein